MKKSVAVLAAIFLAAGAFCQESGKGAQTGDVYDDTAEMAEENQASEKKESVFSRFTKSEQKSTELAESSLFKYNNFRTDVKEEEIAICYYPQWKEIGFSFDKKNSLIISFDKVAQQTLKDAFGRYEKEFEEKSLNKKSSKTIQIYGKIKCHYNYDTVFKDHDAEPTASLGYVFVKKSPYFTLTIPSVEISIKNPVDGSRTGKTEKLKLLFNKNQMRTLIEQFDYSED